MTINSSGILAGGTGYRDLAFFHGFQQRRLDFGGRAVDFVGQCNRNIGPGWNLNSPCPSIE